MLTLLAKLLAALNSENSPRQIALAIAMGMVVGLSPLLSLHNVLFLLLVFILKINLSTFFIALAGFSGLALLGAPLFSSIGEQLLHAPALYTSWTYLYQASLFKLAHFHHTLTLGSLVASLILFIPVMLISEWLILRYRVHIKAWIEKFHIINTLKASRFYKIYLGLSGTGV
jgi:uncharacterized protein (TIGR03546 family)